MKLKTSMNKIGLLLFVLLMSCNTEKKPPKTDLWGIDSIRYEMAKTYKEGQVKAEDDFEIYNFKPCIPCDLDFLVRLDSKSKLTKKDVENLLCIDKGCENNAEFRQFYNEVLIKSFNKSPKLFFTEVRSLTRQNYDKVLIELQNPINDAITASEASLQLYFINIIQ